MSKKRLFIFGIEIDDDRGIQHRRPHSETAFVQTSHLYRVISKHEGWTERKGSDKIKDASEKEK
jgi:hypothetical protein